MPVACFCCCYGATYLRVGNALMLVTPNHQVQPPCQVALLDQVLGALRVRHAVLVQHKHVEPLARGHAILRGGAHPARRARLSGACIAGVAAAGPRLPYTLCVQMLCPARRADAARGAPCDGTGRLEEAPQALIAHVPQAIQRQLCHTLPPCWKRQGKSLVLLCTTRCSIVRQAQHARLAPSG